MNDHNKNKSRIIGDCVPSQLYITSNNEQNYTLSLFIIVSDHIHHHLSLNTSHHHLSSRARVQCQHIVSEISAAGQRQSEPWETGRAPMSSSLIQIIIPSFTHPDYRPWPCLSHGKWKQNWNKTISEFYWHRFSRRRKSLFLNTWHFRGKRWIEKMWMRLQTSNVRAPLSLHWMREFVVWIPILFLCFCTLWSHYAALCAHIMLRGTHLECH